MESLGLLSCSCPLHVTVRESVARWAARSIELGGGNRFTALVLGPSGVPEVTDEKEAHGDPELAVLSAMAHGKDRETTRAVRIAVAAMAASVGLDLERSTLYFDLVAASLSTAARKALQSMDPTTYEYQSAFAKRYLKLGLRKGEAKGRAEGRAELVLKQLAARFGPLPEGTEQRVRRASIAQSDILAERLLTAPTLEAALLTRRKRSRA